jgi:hypothetical protein
MIPFGIAVSVMGTRELWLSVVLPWQRRRRLSEACQAPTPDEAPEAAKAKAPLPFAPRSRVRSRQ